MIKDVGAVRCIRGNDEYISLGDRLCFGSNSHHHFPFKDDCHNLFRMPMIGDEASRFKFHMPQLGIFQGERLYMNSSFEFFR